MKQLRPVIIAGVSDDYKRKDKTKNAINFNKKAMPQPLKA